MIENKNFSWGRLERFIPTDGEVIKNCNLAQMYPNTVIAEGVTGLTFENCILINCVVPADAVIVGGTNAAISYCGHIHEGFTCAENCEHVISSEDIIIDGVTIDTIYQYKDTVVI